MMLLSENKYDDDDDVKVCCLEFDRKDIEMNKLVATCLESKVHVFDVRTQHPRKGFASVTEKVTS